MKSTATSVCLVGAAKMGRAPKDVRSRLRGISINRAPPSAERPMRTSFFAARAVVGRHIVMRMRRQNEDEAWT